MCQALCWIQGPRRGRGRLGEYKQTVAGLELRMPYSLQVSPSLGSFETCHGVGGSPEHEQKRVVVTITYVTGEGAARSVLCTGRRDAC